MIGMGNLSLIFIFLGHENKGVVEGVWVHRKKSLRNDIYHDY
jgi:hypothetical protein